MILAGILLAAEVYGPYISPPPMEAGENSQKSDAMPACPHSDPDEIVVCVAARRVYNQRLTTIPGAVDQGGEPGPLHAKLGQVDLTASGPAGRYSPSVGLNLHIHF